MVRDPAIRQIVLGNISLVVCCGFYLLWWVLAFKPSGAIGGSKTGFLLIPALIMGLAAVLRIVKGILRMETGPVFFSNGAALIAGILAYVVLLAVTAFLMKRPVTTELLLIVGWAVLALVEVNSLYGINALSHSAAVGFFVLAAVCTGINLVCYVLFFHLNEVAGYVDGMIPLLLAATVMILISYTVMR